MLFSRHNVKSGNAAQNFFRLLAEGLVANPGVNVSVISLLPVNSAEQKKIFWKFRPEEETGIRYEYIPLVNLPLIRNLFSNIYLFFKLLFRKFPKDTDNYIFVDYLRFTLNMAVVMAAWIRGVKVLTVVTDLPGLDVLNPSLMSRIRNRFIFLLQYDYYVCLTGPLNAAVNKKNRPYRILEGFIDQNIRNTKNEPAGKFEERVIVYAGSLYERYGIKSLIEGFMRIPDDDARLWLYGVGPFADAIREYSQKDNRILYKGIIPTAELLEILVRSTILVNPRPTHEDFTLYSFPSKNLEYMSTGTPLLTTRLPGIPEDHYPYVYFIGEDSADGIFSGLKNVLQMTREELHAFGCAAKEFTLREKNNARQADKIIGMLKDNI